MEAVESARRASREEVLGEILGPNWKGICGSDTPSVEQQRKALQAEAEKIASPPEPRKEQLRVQGELIIERTHGVRGRNLLEMEAEMQAWKSGKPRKPKGGE